MADDETREATSGDEDAPDEDAPTPTTGPRFARMLVPIDASRTSRKALQVGLDIADAMGSHVTALYVMDSSAYAAFPGDLEWESIKDLLEKESDTALSDAKAACQARGVPCEGQVREGHPAHEIIQAAAGHDIVVMGTHGRSGLEHLLLGSVTEKVIRHAPCPVLVVRRDDDEDDDPGDEGNEGAT